MIDDSIHITKVDDVWMHVSAPDSIRQEMADFFTFTVPGAGFMPSVRNKHWDGKIRLYNQLTRRMYFGLHTYINKFAEERDYEVEYGAGFDSDEFSLFEAKQFLRKLNLPFEVRDYQTDAFAHCMKNKRALMVSPTASGKSLIIHMICQYFYDMWEMQYEGKILIIVPTTSLVHQMYTDFEEYGMLAEHPDYGTMMHRIMEGYEKDSEAMIQISTWQSIHRLPKTWFKKFDVVIGDEAHLFKAKSLTTIMTKLESTPYRFGFTGTLADSQTHKLVLEGLFGPAEQVTTTSELIEDGTLAQFNVKGIVLKYPEWHRRQVSKYKYKDELDFLVSNPERNRFIKNLIYSLKGNTLLLYQFVEKHGKVIYDLLESDKNLIKEKPTFFVHGGVKAEEREKIRGIVEEENDAVIVASYGTFSTGINIRNLDNVVFASPSKSKIRVLQSIGRGLRRSERKTKATLFDIADDLQWKSKKNYTLDHFAERIKMYNIEKFDYKIYKVNLK
mgnify:CR=1 FL=1